MFSLDEENYTRDRSTEVMPVSRQTINTISSTITCVSSVPPCTLSLTPPMPVTLTHTIPTSDIPQIDLTSSTSECITPSSSTLTSTSQSQKSALSTAHDNVNKKVLPLNNVSSVGESVASEALSSDISDKINTVFNDFVSSCGNIDIKVIDRLDSVVSSAEYSSQPETTPKSSTPKQIKDERKVKLKLYDDNKTDTESDARLIFSDMLKERNTESKVERYDSVSDFLKTPIYTTNQKKLTEYLSSNCIYNVEPQHTQSCRGLLLADEVCTRDRHESICNTKSVASFDIAELMFGDTKTVEKTRKTKKKSTSGDKRICILRDQNVQNVTSKNVREVKEENKQKNERKCDRVVGNMKVTSGITKLSIGKDLKKLEQKLEKKSEYDKILSNICSMNKVANTSTLQYKVINCRYTFYNTTNIIVKLLIFQHSQTFFVKLV